MRFGKTNIANTCYTCEVSEILTKSVSKPWPKSCRNLVVDTEPLVPPWLDLYDWWEDVFATFEPYGINFEPRSSSDQAVHINITFENLGNYLGIAWPPVGKCVTIQTKLSTTAPLNKEFRATALMHELGHNLGLGHQQFGVMSPYNAGRPLNWEGDPAERILIALYGPRITSPKTTKQVKTKLVTSVKPNHPKSD